MKRILAVILFFPAATSLALGQRPTGKKKRRGKRPAWSKFYCRWDDWTGQSPAGIQTKAQAMADLKSEDQKFDSINFMRDLPDREMDKAFFFFKLNTQTEIEMRKENVR
jgi:hypothetical protein